MQGMTPEQFDEHLAAKQAEPWGELRADYRTAFLAWWICNAFGSSTDDMDAADFLDHFHYFVENKKTAAPDVVIGPSQAAKLSGAR